MPKFAKIGNTITKLPLFGLCVRWHHMVPTVLKDVTISSNLFSQWSIKWSGVLFMAPKLVMEEDADVELVSMPSFCRTISISLTTVLIVGRSEAVIFERFHGELEKLSRSIQVGKVFQGWNNHLRWASELFCHSCLLMFWPPGQCTFPFQQAA